MPRADQGTRGGVPAGPSVCSFCGPSWCLRPASMAWNMGTGRTLLVPTPHSESALFPLIWGPVGTPLGFPRGRGLAAPMATLGPRLVRPAGQGDQASLLGGAWHGLRSREGPAPAGRGPARGELWGGAACSLALRWTGRLRLHLRRLLRSLPAPARAAQLGGLWFPARTTWGWEEGDGLLLVRRDVAAGRSGKLRLCFKRVHPIA